jgi:hypothetical protein
LTSSSNSHGPSLTPPSSTHGQSTISAAKWRWTIVAAVSLAALVGGSLIIGDYLWYGVSGRTTAFFVYLGWMSLILGAAAGIAGLAVRIFFPGYDSRLNTRRRVNNSPEDDFLEIQRTGATFQPLTVYYSLFMVAAAVGAMFVAQNISKGALFAFKVVQLEAMSRSSDAEELQSLFAEIEELQQPEEVVRFVQKLQFYYEDDREAVREAAYVATEVMAHRMNLSVYLLVQEGQLLESRWEPSLLTWMNDEMAPLLRDLAERGVTPQPAIVAALARIARGADFPFFLQLVEDPKVVDATFAQAAIGLGNLARFEAARPLIVAIPKRSGPAQTRIFWALERIANALQKDIAQEDQDEEVWEVVESLLALLGEVDDAGRCGLVMVIKSFQHAQAISPLLEFFDTEGASITCPRVELTEPVGPPRAYIKEDRLRWLLLNVLAEIGAGNGQLRSWLGQALTRSYDEQVMRGLRQLYGQLSREPDNSF